jgi:hypothetical protein
MKIAETIFYYFAAALIFPYAWLCEQRRAIRMAWFDSFVPAHAHVREIWMKRRHCRQGGTHRKNNL